MDTLSFFRVPTLVIALILLGPAVSRSHASAQALLADPTPVPTSELRNSAFFELLGSGGLYSVNYERRWAERVALRTGFATWDSTDLFAGEGQSERIWTIPVTASFLRGGRTGGLEVGGGFLVGRESSEVGPSREILAFTGILGYRRSPRDSRLLLRATVNPFMDLTGNESAYPDEGLFVSVGLSAGLVF